MLPLPGRVADPQDRLVCTKNDRLRGGESVEHRSVIGLVADDGVLDTEQCFEQITVGVRACGMKRRLLGAKEPRETSLEPLLQMLRTANETPGT